MTDDLQHLKLLSIFHYIVAGITALAGCIPFIHLALGIAFVSGGFPNRPNEPVPPAVLGWIFIGFASAAIALTWSLAVALAWVASFLKQQRRYTFCLVVAGIECLFMPFGTVLGVFTIIVLVRPSVRQLFDKEAGAISMDASSAP